MCEDDDFPDHCGAEFSDDEGCVWICFLEDAHRGEHDFTCIDEDESE